MSQQITIITIPYEALTEKSPTNNRFETIFTKAVEETFIIFGETVKQAIYNTLEKSYNIRKTEIPSKIEVFSHAIDAIFAESALLVELKIIEKLGKIEGFKFKSGKGEFLFADYVEAVKTYLSALHC